MEVYEFFKIHRRVMAVKVLLLLAAIFVFLQALVTMVIPVRAKVSGPGVASFALALSSVAAILGLSALIIYSDSVDTMAGYDLGWSFDVAIAGVTLALASVVPSALAIHQCYEAHHLERSKTMFPEGSWYSRLI
jgi:heme A synthase